MTAAPTPGPPPSVALTPTSAPTPGDDEKKFEDRYSDTFDVGEGKVLIRFSVRRPNLTAQLNKNQGGQQLVFELLDSGGASS